MSSKSLISNLFPHQKQEKWEFDFPFPQNLVHPISVLMSARLWVAMSVVGRSPRPSTAFHKAKRFAKAEVRTKSYRKETYRKDPSIWEKILLFFFFPSNNRLAFSSKAAFRSEGLETSARLAAVVASKPDLGTQNQRCLNDFFKKSSQLTISSKTVPSWFLPKTQHTLLHLFCTTNGLPPRWLIQEKHRSLSDESTCQGQTLSFTTGPKGSGSGFGFARKNQEKTSNWCFFSESLETKRSFFLRWLLIVLCRASSMAPATTPHLDPPVHRSLGAFERKTWKLEDSWRLFTSLRLKKAKKESKDNESLSFAFLSSQSLRLPRQRISEAKQKTLVKFQSLPKRRIPSTLRLWTWPGLHEAMCRGCFGRFLKPETNLFFFK